LVAVTRIERDPLEGLLPVKQNGVVSFLFDCPWLIRPNSAMCL
jgi:hypothetical protein